MLPSVREGEAVMNDIPPVAWLHPFLYLGTKRWR